MFFLIWTMHSRQNYELLIEAENGNIGRVKTLLALGANINGPSADIIPPPPFPFSLFSFIPFIKVYSTPLMAAACEGHTDLVKFLLEKGADVNAHDEGGYTALGGAVAQGHKAVVEILIANGAKVDTRDQYGKAPLDYALEKKRKALANLLRQYGGQRGKP